MCKHEGNTFTWIRCRTHNMGKSMEVWRTWIWGIWGKCSVWVRMRKPWQDGTSSLAVFGFCPNDNEMISSCLLLGWICLSRKILEPSSSYCFSTVKIVPQYKHICFIFFPDLLFKLIKLQPTPWKWGFCSLSTHQISEVSPWKTKTVVFLKC